MAVRLVEPRGTRQILVVVFGDAVEVRDEYRVVGQHLELTGCGLGEHGNRIAV